MDSAPKSKKQRTKSSTRKTNPQIRRATIDEVLIDNEPAVVTAPKTARYAESSSLAIRSGVELGQDQAMEDLAARQVDGTLDADLAELSLGQRLTALNGTDVANKGSESDNEEEASSKLEKKQDSPNIVPAHSLTRTLIQALHSSDSRLLEACLAHSETALIRNTVTRLPPQLAIPLLLACVERLGRGARAANMKGGGGGGASSQRGMVLITWVKTTLTVHSGHLMTMPDLVARLAGLHATLTSRLALQDSLLSLTGKLDMVLSQIEMRSSSAPAPLTSNKDSITRANGVRKPTQYMEGESEGEEDQMNVEPPIESGDEEGSVEDIELGGESEGDDEGEEDDDDDVEEDDDDEGSDGNGSVLNGSIDDEAEEEFDDEEDDESE
ncbi:NUC189-domain-containing protein [Gyrodon lividus]|nr:NUC189-domain-containing protein [Gyrodon lividus]